VEVRKILEWTLKYNDIRAFIGFNWLRIGLMADCCEHGKKPSGSIKDREFLDKLADYKLLCSVG